MFFMQYNVSSVCFILGVFIGVIMGMMYMLISVMFQFYKTKAQIQKREQDFSKAQEKSSLVCFLEGCWVLTSH